MRYTNLTNLPKSVYNALTQDSHKKGDYSVTEIIKPVQELILCQRYDSEIEIDASENVSKLIGKGFHKIIEESCRGVKDVYSELYLEKEFPPYTVLSGCIDLLINDIIYDIKTTSVYAVMKMSSFDSWTDQLNLYRLLALDRGIAVNRLKIIAVMLDWHKTESMHNPNYPQQRVKIIDIPVYNYDDVEFSATRKLMLINECKQLPDDQIKVCLPQDQWRSETKFAVVKKGAKRATKVFTSKEGAEYYVAENNLKDAEVITRPGEPVKCNNYCLAKKFCKQYQLENNYCENKETSQFSDLEI